MTEILFLQRYVLMALVYLEVCQPQATICSDDFLPILIYANFCAVLLIVSGNYKSRNPAPKVDAKPYFVLLNKLKNLLVSYGVYVADYEELLVVPDDF